MKICKLIKMPKLFVLVGLILSQCRKTTLLMLIRSSGWPPMSLINTGETNDVTKITSFQWNLQDDVLVKRTEGSQ